MPEQFEDDHKRLGPGREGSGRLLTEGGNPEPDPPAQSLFEEQLVLRAELRRLREEQQHLREEQERLKQEKGQGEKKDGDQKKSDGKEQPATEGEKKPDEKKDEKKEEQKDERPAPEKARSWVREHPVALVVGLVALIGLAIGGFFLWNYLQSYESTDDAQIDGHLNAVTARIQGTVVGVYVEDNQFVKAGQVLLDLDPRDYKIELERSKADLQQAQAQVQASNPNVQITTTTNESTVSTSQAEIANATAGIASAQAEYEAAIARLREAEANNVKAQTDVARYQVLVEKDEVSRELYDQKVATAKAAAATVESNRAAANASLKVIDQRRAALNQAETRLQEARRNAPRQEAIQRATVISRQASALVTKAAVDQAALNIQYTKIYAPVDGIVGKRGVEVGQHIQPGQELMAVTQLNDIWVTANFKETQLRHMKAGQSISIKVDAFKTTYDGYLEQLAGATGAKYSLLPPENATGNYVKVVQRLPVRIRLKPGQDPDHRLRPGMSVEPKVWLN